MTVSVISRLNAASFSVVRRGYDRDQVECFLHEIARELADAEARSAAVQARATRPRPMPQSRRLIVSPPRSEPADADAEGDRIVKPAARESPAAAPSGGRELAASRRLIEAEQQAAKIVGEARERARAIGAEAESTRRKVHDAAARARADARVDADRLRAAAVASVRELIELGRAGPSRELDRAFSALSAATGAEPAPASSDSSEVGGPDPASPPSSGGAAGQGSALAELDLAELERDLNARISALRQPVS